MKKFIKIIFEIIQVAILYVMLTVYGYYNEPKPIKWYSWLVYALIVIIVYPIVRFACTRNKK